ncbi:MAG: type II secretion system protein J [Methylobacter sp.]
MKVQLQDSMRQRGFTLIEVLIAMTLLSIMVVLLFSSLRICAQSWEQGENKIGEVNEAAVVYAFFQRHLSSAIPLWNDFADQKTSGTGTPAPAQRDNKTFSFQGTRQSLQFVSVFPASAGRSGMQLFTIAPDNEQAIKVTLTPFFPATEGEGWRQEEVVLLKRVSDFSLAYFGDAEGQGEYRWHEQWLEKNTQPSLIKINISTENGLFWPDMIIAVKIASADNQQQAQSPETFANPFGALR